MGIHQIAISVCNDGNVSQLDCADPKNSAPHYRIEVYRCSQPAGGFGITLCGSKVEDICGREHLSDRSNKIFRYVFAFEPSSTNPSGNKILPVVLEGREEFNPPGMPDGSWDVRIRDLDAHSNSYGSVVRATVAPASGDKRYDLHYEFRRADSSLPKVPISSPVQSPLTVLNPGLVDLGDLNGLPAPVGINANRLAPDPQFRPSPFALSLTLKRAEVDDALAEHLTLMSHADFSKFRSNLDEYEEFGDFGAKCVHPGTNLTGPNARLAAESIFVRQYRAALVLLGRLSSPEMANGASAPMSLAKLRTNTRPGVYNIFIGAAINQVGIYKLGLDKVHSDYGGIPMLLAPGSRLENDAEPKADAWRCNQTLGEVANLYYLNDPVGAF